MALSYPVSVTPVQQLAYAIMQGAGLNTQLIWPQVAPSFGLNQRTAHLPQFTIAGAEIARIISQITAPGADAPRMTAAINDFSFAVGLRRIEMGIPDENQMDWDKLFSLLLFYSNLIGNKMLSLSLEYMVANQIFSTANFGSATAAGSAYTQANLGSYSLIGDILSAIEKVRDQGEQPDTIIMSSRNLERAGQATNVIQYTLGALAGVGAKVTAGAIQSAFAEEGITQVLVGRSQINTAAKGAAPVLTRVWSDTYIWVGQAGNVAQTDNMGIPMISGAVVTPYWEPYGLMSADNYRDEPKMQEVVRGKLSGNPTLINANAGTLIATSFA